MTNAEKYAPQIAKILTNMAGVVCLYFAKDIDGYGNFQCSTCPLKGVCYDTDKLEKFLRQEAKTND